MPQPARLRKQFRSLVSTAGDVKAVDVAWLAPNRAEIGQDPIVFVRARDICIEILLPSRTAIQDEDIFIFSSRWVHGALRKLSAKYATQCEETCRRPTQLPVLNG